MPKEFMLIVVAAMLGAVLSFSMAAAGGDAAGPYYGENDSGNPLEDGGPYAENCFQMSDEAPAGPNPCPPGPGGN